MTKITRNTADGTLFIEDAPGVPQKVRAVLRGGNYDLFFGPKTCPKSLVHAGNPITRTYEVNQAPCQPPANRNLAARFVSWEEGRNTFGEFFGAMTRSRCNFVRVFLSLATRRDRAGLLNMVPYVSALDGDRVVYDVRGAVGGTWNDDYFDRLTAFVHQADAAGVVVQLSLFNYFDIAPDEGDTNYRSAFSQFAASPWNADNCMNKRWGAEHLIKLTREDLPNPEKNPQVQFTSTRTDADKLWLVQDAYIGRVMSAVAGRENVVLEIMNEPHQVFDLQDLERVVRFNSAMTAIVKARRGTSLHPLISVNATYQIRNLQPVGRSDMEFWFARREQIGYFADVDVVSYHALTAKPGFDVPSCAEPGTTVKVERVDQAAIDERATFHAEGGPLHDKALVYSTDAVLSEPYKHVYPEEPVLMLLRDGQIDCKQPANPTTKQELMHTDVKHWAFKCMKKNAGRVKGKYHFQNHSSFDAGIRKIGEAAADAGL